MAVLSGGGRLQRRNSGNHALDLLGLIMNFAVARGHVDANPARSILKNRRPRLTRFLSREEVARLHAALDRQTRRGDREQAHARRQVRSCLNRPFKWQFLWSAGFGQFAPGQLPPYRVAPHTGPDIVSMRRQPESRH